MTVAEGRTFKADMPGGHSKNLFLKDKRAELTLVTAHCDTNIDLVALGRQLGAKGRFSFASPERMQEVLAISPGAVTPFALLNAQASQLANVILDKAFFDFETVWFHPLRNTASTAISPADLLAFVRSTGHEPQIFSF
jgi:Ala-tRNA(Pro) deacylase